MSLLSRLRNAISPRRLDRELHEELSDHIERRVAELRHTGLTEQEARRQAALRFGNITGVRERSRELRLSATLESAFQDVRYAWRGMRKSPAFAVTSILSLALAIGANTAIYSIVDAAMLRPLPVPQPDRLFRLAAPEVEQPGVERTGEREAFSYPLYLRLRSASQGMTRLALFSAAGSGPVEIQIPNADAPIEKANRQFVSGEAFDILQVPPALGRVFSAEEDRIPGGHPVAVISHDYWKRRFSGDPNILGRNMLISGKTYSIIGVARQGFFGIEPGRFADIWVPAMMYAKAAFGNPGWNWFRIAGRLNPGVTRSQVQARFQPIFTEHWNEILKTRSEMPASIREQFLQLPLLVHPGAEGISGFRNVFARALWIVLGVAIGILMIACANVASLLLARSTARAAEMAMRVSLGAGRSRLMRQLLTESLILSLAAGALGWVLSSAAAPLLVRLLSTQAYPVRFDLALDTRVLFFCVAVSTLAAVLFGVLPAWQASNADPIENLRGVRGRGGRLRLGRLCVGIQVAFAFCLVIGGASFLFSLRNLFHVETGFDPRNVHIILVSNKLSEATQKAELNTLLDQFQRRIEALPGVQSAATAGWMLFDGTRIATPLILPGRTKSDREEIIGSVSPRYFSAMRIPLIAGRDFEPRDRDYSNKGPRPTIINEALARRYFADGNPVGRTFSTPEDAVVQHQVIGVVGNSAYGSLRDGPQPIIYTVTQGTNYFAVYVRSPLGLDSIVKMVEREERAIGHGMRIHEVTTLETLIGETLLREKLLAGVGGVFALLGLLLAAIGLFGLLNYSVARRTKEIGIRAAIGARPSDLVVLVLKDMLVVTGGGLAAGLIGSLALLTGVRSLLFGIGPADPLAVGASAAVFLAAAFVAGGWPAARAARIDPLDALRHD